MPPRLPVIKEIGVRRGLAAESAELNYAVTDSTFKVPRGTSFFFEAFCGIRDQLATKGFFPLCYGASRCVYPSGICRDWSAGLIAYRMEMGKAVSRGSVVNIFDTGPDVEVATVAAQRAIFSEWSGRAR